MKLLYLYILIFVFTYSCKSEVSKIETLPHYKTYLDSLDTYAKNPAVVELGEDLFFDPILSRDSSVSCASCHFPKKAFTDGKSIAVGIGGRISSRNAPTLTNLAIHPVFMSDGGNATLEIQALTPIRDTNEMGSDVKTLIEKLRKSEYNKRSKELFDEDFTPYTLTRSLAAFQKNLISLNSPFDQWYYLGEEDVISASAKKGFNLFDEKLNCTACHALPYFTNFTFENNGLLENYEDKGRFMVTGDSNDLSKFKVPTLRNIALTAPYLHNGSINSLDSIVNLYANGGYSFHNKSDLIEKSNLTTQDKENLIDFFESLTDTSFVSKLKPEHRF